MSACLFQIAWEESFDFLLIIYKWQFLSRFSILHEKWRHQATSTLLDETLTWEFKDKFHSLSPNHVWKLDSFFNCEKRSLLTVELKNLTTKQRKNSPVCGFDVAFLSNVFKVFEKLWAIFNTKKKLFNPAQVALTKIPRNKAKIYQKPDFLSSEGHLLTSPGTCLTFASSLDIAQVRFFSWSFYCVLLGNDLCNLLAVSVACKNSFPSSLPAQVAFRKKDVCDLPLKIPYWWRKSVPNLLMSADWFDW